MVHPLFIVNEEMQVQWNRELRVYVLHRSDAFAMDQSLGIAARCSYFLFLTRNPSDGEALWMGKASYNDYKFRVRILMPI
jgi:hypothetical protein